MGKAAGVVCAVGALLGGAWPALGYSQVQLYGRVNTALEWQQTAGHSASGLTSNGSFLGLQGHEALASGYRAGFALEADIFTDDGAAGSWREGLDFRRRSELSLAAQWGMLRLGRFDNASYAMVAEPLNLLNDNAGSISDFNFQTGNTANSLAYRSPAMGGWTLEVQRNLGEKREVAPNTEDRGGWDVGAAYAQGPWGVALGHNYSKWVGMRDDYRNVEQSTSAQLSYTAAQWLLGGYYQWTRYEVQSAGLAKERDERGLARLVGMYRWGASALHANVSRTYMLKGPAASLNHWTLGYHYHLSPRSRVYALWGRLDRFSPHAFPNLWRYGLQGDAHTSVLLGVRHVF